MEHPGSPYQQAFGSSQTLVSGLWLSNRLKYLEKYCDLHTVRQTWQYNTSLTILTIVAFLCSIIAVPDRCIMWKPDKRMKALASLSLSFQPAIFFGIQDDATWGRRQPSPGGRWPTPQRRCKKKKRGYPFHVHQLHQGRL